jgi:hypothetical protein
VLFAFIGFVHFRLRFFSYVVKIRSAEVIMATWLGGVSLMLLFKFRRLELADFVLLVPPLVFYAKKLLDFRWFRRLRWLVLLATVAMPVSMYLSFWGMYAPDSLAALQPSKEARWLHGGQWPPEASERQAIRQIQQQFAGQSIWIMDHQPALALRLGATSPNRYTDFRMLVLKFPPLTEEEPGDLNPVIELISKPESDRAFYLALRENLPDLILDPYGLFPGLQTHFPNLLQPYAPASFGDYQAYVLQARATP